MTSFNRALVTGATSGIGAAFASKLPETTDLLLTGRDEEKLARAQQKLARKGRTIITICADLADEQAVMDLVDRANAFGVDLLINNAGVGQLGRIVDNALEAERNTAMLNTVAVVLLTRGLLPGIVDRARQNRRRGGVIIVSSTAAFAPVPYFATYAASKAFDLLFAEALSEEMRSEPVDILALCPGSTRTNFASRAGFDLGHLPGAANPTTVAREALHELGRKTVHVTGAMSQATLGPFLIPRRMMTGALGTAMRFFSSRMG